MVGGGGRVRNGGVVGVGVAHAGARTHAAACTKPVNDNMKEPVLRIHSVSDPSSFYTYPDPDPA